MSEFVSLKTALLRFTMQPSVLDYRCATTRQNPDSELQRLCLRAGKRRRIMSSSGLNQRIMWLVRRYVQHTRCFQFKNIRVEPHKLSKATFASALHSRNLITIVLLLNLLLYQYWLCERQPSLFWETFAFRGQEAIFGIAKFALS